MSSGSGSRASIDYDDYFRKEGKSKRAECIRNRTNFTVPKSFHLVDKKDFNPDMLNLYIKNDASPKLKLLLNKIKLLDGDGFGNLDKIWTTCNKSKLAIVFPNIVGLIYDCDTNKPKGDNHMAKKRVIPTVSSNPISKGIENLIPASRINNLRESHPQFFDITPEVERKVRAVSPIQPETCEINKDEKGNLCKWLCENGTAEDFAQFEFVFTLIEEIIEHNQ
jgi:hypothetical protein